MSSYARGILLVMSAGVCWSIGGIMLRSMEAATGWQVLFYRALGMTLTLLIVMVVRHRIRVFAIFRASGFPGIAGGLCLATAVTTNVFSMLNTTVASTMFMQSTQIFFAAALGWVFLRERVHGATWCAIAVALVGVGVMVSDGFERGTLTGNLLALTTGLAAAGFAVSFRAGRMGDMLSAACLGGIFTAVASGLMAGDLVVNDHDLALGLVMGVIQFGLGFTLFTLGSRLVPAAELMLLALTEVVLAPVWVWLGMGERASAMTLLGGSIIIAAISAVSVVGMHRRGRATNAATVRTS